MTGQAFGGWRVVDDGSADRTAGRAVEVVCRCGLHRHVKLGSLLNGRSTQCRQCAEETRAQPGRKHGLHLHGLYGIYRGMIDRCTNPKSTGWRYYGGRGIGVDPEWLGEDGPARFIADMGPRPSKEHSVERVDNAAGYGARNCVWATRLEQAANKRARRLVPRGLSAAAFWELVYRWAAEDGHLVPAQTAEPLPIPPLTSATG